MRSTVAALAGTLLLVGCGQGCSESAAAKKPLRAAWARALPPKPYTADLQDLLVGRRVSFDDVYVDDLTRDARGRYVFKGATTARKLGDTRLEFISAVRPSLDPGTTRAVLEANVSTVEQDTEPGSGEWIVRGTLVSASLGEVK